MSTGLRASLLACFGLAVSMSCAGAAEPAGRMGQDRATATGAPAAARAKPARRQRGPRRKQSDKFSNIWLTTQHGRRVRFYDDLVKNKVVMINLMYTTCPKICPANTVRLARLHDMMQRWMGRDITILSLSIDSQVDTPALLKQYWQAFGAKPGWYFLTGDYDEIERLRRELGVYDLDPVIDADKTEHSGILTIGNDRTNRWIALPILMHARQLAATVLRNTWDRHWQRRANRAKPPAKRSSPP